MAGESSAAQDRPSFDECGFRPAGTPCECGWEDEQAAAQDRFLVEIEKLIVECEEGPLDYNSWPSGVTIKAARAAFDKLRAGDA